VHCRNRYIFKYWTSQSSLCAQWISIWAPLVVQHTYRYSVSGQVLTSISLVTHSAALTILTRNSFTFCFFTINNVFYRPSEEKIQRSQENEGARSKERQGLIFFHYPLTSTGCSLSEYI